MEQLVADALTHAQKCGASAAEASVSVDAGLSVKVRMREVDTLEYQRDRGFGVTVYFGQRKGSASSADFSPASIRETVEAACTIARYTSEDNCQGLADAALMARDIPDLDLYHPWALEADAAIALARDCEVAALDADPRIVNSDGADVSSHGGVRVYGNTHGFIGGYHASRHGLSCVSVGKQNDEMQRDYWFTVSRRPDLLEAAQTVGKKAAERTLRRLGARRVGTARVPVLFAPEVARGVLGHFLGAIRGGAQYRKASFLYDKLGEQVFPSFVQIEEQPHLPCALGSAAFDSEGVATVPRHLVRDGVLETYLLGSYSARKLGMQSTGHAGGVHNLVVQPGEFGFDELVRHMGRGLVVTSLMGQGVNMVTGDYSRGASGFWVEDGALAYPVQEITVAGNLRDMLANIQAIGSDVDLRGNVRTGSILIDGLTVAGE
ncbi:metalloprotease PmbA [Alkalilimnicola ehrlichii]|uniref:Metalloprotease PmbA n=1 Tax=Alkalilimnicola ehrlichii TaxID=351052 RepID=A0A3E0X0Y6_9GAMM|nr:metalloprotease PmbA [Alkalilimnicola ehrlichii]RFA37956.1 metalloprotease PmbA [Alkalilimnicola ehrlichii]